MADDQPAAEMRWAIEARALASPAAPGDLEQILAASRYRGRYL